MPIPIFNFSNKIYLDTIDIHITCLLTKLVHWHLGLYIVEKQVSLILYRLKLFSLMRRLYSVLFVVKLTSTPKDPTPS